MGFFSLFLFDFWLIFNCLFFFFSIIYLVIVWNAFNGLNWENTRSLKHFCFFSLENRKSVYVLSDVFWIPPTLFPPTPLQSLRVATSSATGCYVLREATPKGDPGLAPDSAALRFRLHDPSLLPFRSFRKVVRDPKKSSRTNRFSVLSEEKKKDRKNV